MTTRPAYDCIVIGAGMSGLTFAALAAQRGQRVLVAEQHYLPGGLFTAFKRGPFLFNVALEWTTDCGAGQPLHRLLCELGLAEEYRFRQLSLFKTVLAPELAAPIPLFCSADRLRAELTAAFPHQAAPLETFLADCQATLEDSERSRILLRTRGLKSVEAMLSDYFDDPLLIHLLYSVLSYPAARGVLLMYLLGALCQGQIYVPVHWDHRRLGLLLHRKLVSLGGEVLYRQPVSAILVEDGAARGIRLASGVEHHAPLVVAGVDAEQLYTRLLPSEFAETRRASDLLGRQPGLSTFSLFLGLDGELPRESPNDYSYSLLSDTASWRADPENLAHAPLRVEFQSALHPQLAPGKATLCLWAAVPVSAFDYWGQGRDCDREEMNLDHYEAAKSQATKILLQRIEAAFPGVGRRIERMETATPFTVKYYTRNRAGSVSGFSLAAMSYLKPAQSATPVRGLHHIGHWTIQSGVNSVMYSAAQLFRSLYPAESPGDGSITGL